MISIQSIFFSNLKKKNELIKQIKDFKKRNPKYDVFRIDSLGNKRSIDSIYFNGLYNVYLVDFYLPINHKRVGCTTILQEDSCEITTNSLYISGYVTPILPQSNDYKESQFIQFPKYNLTEEQQCIKAELENIFKQIGRFKVE